MATGPLNSPAGHAILYTATSLHEVTPVTGIRTSSFFWIQSLIRDDARRLMLYNRAVIGSLAATHPETTVRLGFLAEQPCSIGRAAERAAWAGLRVGEKWNSGPAFHGTSG